MLGEAAETEVRHPVNLYLNTEIVDKNTCQEMTTDSTQYANPRILLEHMFNTDTGTLTF